MGCTNTKGQIYVVEKQRDISNRDINEENDQIEAQQNHLQDYACGYSFSYKFQNAQTSSSPNQQETKLEREKTKAGHFLQVCASMKEKFISGQIDDAFWLREQVKKQYDEIDSSLLPKEWSKKKQQIFVLMEQIEEKHHQLTSFQKQLLHQKSIEQDQLKLSYHNHQQYVKVCISNQTNTPLDLLVATFASFVRYSQFMKFSPFSKEVNKLSNFKRLGQVGYDFPFCSRNKTYLLSTVYNRLNHDKTVFICLQSLYKHNKLCDELQFFPIYESEHKLQLSSVACRLEYLGTNKTRISLLFRIKTGIQGIAEWILEKMYKNIAVESMKKLIERANAYGEETASESFEGDNEIYHYFHALLKGQASMQ